MEHVARRRRRTTGPTGFATEWCAAGVSRVLMALVLTFVGFGASAAWIDRGGGMIYDTVLDITWLQDWNYAATELTDSRRDAIIAAAGSIAGHALSGADFEQDGTSYTGRMTWWGAMAWAAELAFGGYSDWRLPATPQPDSSCKDQEHSGGFPEQGVGRGCTGSEMGSLFSRIGPGENWPAPIVTPDWMIGGQYPLYWSADEYEPEPFLVQAWSLKTHNGYQDFDYKEAFGVAVAVRRGDVPQQTASEPGLLSLALGGMGALAMARRRPQGQQLLPAS